MDENSLFDPDNLDPEAIAYRRGFADGAAPPKARMRVERMQVPEAAGPLQGIVRDGRIPLGHQVRSDSALNVREGVLAGVAARASVTAMSLRDIRDRLSKIAHSTLGPIPSGGSTAGGAKGIEPAQPTAVELIHVEMSQAEQVIASIYEYVEALERL